MDVAGKAAKFLGKLGKRIARNAVQESSLTPETSTSRCAAVDTSSTLAFCDKTCKIKCNLAFLRHILFASTEDADLSTYQRTNSPFFSCSASGTRGYRTAEAADDDEAALAQPPPPERPERAEKANVESSVGLRTLVSGPDGRVYAGFASGHLKCISALGRLLWKKVHLPWAPEPFLCPV